MTKFGLQAHSTLMPDMTQPLRRPAPLEPGGRIAVLAISSPSASERIEPAAEHLRLAGFDVVLASNLYSRERGYLAGSDEVRISEINGALRDDDVDAIFFARGGYGAMRILDEIDYEAIQRNPKPIVGYSDLTALHQAIAACVGITSFHGPMLNTDFFEGLSPDISSWLWSALAGDAPIRFDFSGANVVSEGTARGVLFGGCLSLTASLIGTPYDFWINDGIWFWEDVTEPTYRIDRMLTTLRLSGRLASLRGVMIGKLRECGVGEGHELETLLTEFFGGLGIPVVRELPFGHFGNNLLLPIGQAVTLDTLKRTLTIDEPLVDLAV